MSIQGSAEWFLERCGNATASEFSSVLSKGKEGIMRRKYLRRVVSERLTGKPSETYRGWHTDRGHEQEPWTRMNYEAITGYVVDEVGFIKHPVLMAGCSPDGLVNDDGGVEIKSVIPTVQLDTILRGEYPPEHKAQIQGSLWITGRKWWDFSSGSPDMPPPLDTYIFRVFRDEEYIRELEKEVTAFLSEVDQMIIKLYPKAA